MNVITFQEYVEVCEKNQSAIVDYDVYEDEQLGVILDNVFLPVEISKKSIQAIQIGKIIKSLKKTTQVISVNLTFNQVKNILDRCIKENECLNDLSKINWEVYPGLLVVKILNSNEESTVVWTKPINDGKDQSFKIDWSLDVVVYKYMVSKLEKVFEKNNWSDDIVCFKVRNGSVDIYIDNAESSKLELVLSC